MQNQIDRAHKLLALGLYAEAEEIYYAEIKKGNDFFNYYLAIIYLKNGDHLSSNQFINKIKQNKKFTKEFYNNCGLIKKINYEYIEAEKFFKKAINVDFRYLPAILNLGELYLNNKKIDEAIKLYKNSINRKLENWELYYNLISTLFLNEEYEESIIVSKSAIKKHAENRKIRIKYIELLIHQNLEKDINKLLDEKNSIKFSDQEINKILLYKIKIRKYHEALALIELIDTKEINYYNNLGIVYKELKKYDEALSAYRNGLVFEPDNINLLSNLVNLYILNGKYDEAKIFINKLLELDGKNVFALNANAVIDGVLNIDNGIKSFDEIIIKGIANKDTYFLYGNLLMQVNKFENSIEKYNSTLELDSNYSEAYFNRGSALESLGYKNEAIIDYKKAISINSKIEYLYGKLDYLARRSCEWKDWVKNSSLEKLSESRNFLPLHIISLTDKLEIQKSVITEYSNRFIDKNVNHSTAKNINRKIRIGYYSPDFNSHPISNLLFNIFKNCDRNKFEIYGFYLNNKIDDKTNLLSKCFKEFVYCENLSDAEVQLKSLSIGIDIAVDLAGHTKGARFNLFAMRMANKQVNYLGFPGTSGHSNIDYILADEFLIPREYRNYYSEKVMYLKSFHHNSRLGWPNSFFNNSIENNLKKTNEVIYCCFNNNYKMNPIIFDAWTQILIQVKDSKLHIYVESDVAKVNIINYFNKFPMLIDRLIFSARLNYLDYLERFLSCDIFLDTFPFNGGTTASDALGMGLPVITLSGESYASRMAGSLLKNLELEELIAENIHQYISLAVKIGLNRHTIDDLKIKLQNNIYRSPIFDADSFINNYESVLIEIFNKD